MRLNPGTNPPETATGGKCTSRRSTTPTPPSRGTHPAAWMLTATASSGRPWRADIWPASTAASARDRSTGRRPPDSTVPRGGRCNPEPLPQIQGVSDSGSAEGSYYTWVDQFDTFGLGKNIPINTGNASEGLLVLKDGEWIVLRVPYPLGFLHEMAGWPDRRRGGGLEGQRPVDDREHPRAVSHGGRQRDDEQGHATFSFAPTRSRSERNASDWPCFKL